jgi:glucose uptake protein GlcU
MGYVYAFAAFACIGSYMVPVRFATAKGLGFLPYVGGGILVLDLFRLESLQALWAHPLWFWGTILSGFLWACGQSFANLALEEISLAKASVFFNFNSLINIAIGLIVFKEASGLRAYLLLLAGGILLFLGAWWVARIGAAKSKEVNLKKGLVLSLLTGFFWGVYFTPAKLAQVWDPQSALSSMDVLSGLALGGALPLALLGFFRRSKKGTVRDMGWGLATAGLWALGMVCFLLAIESLGLSRAVPIVNSSSLVYAGWSLFVFKEFPFSQWPKVLGATLLVVLGVTLMAFSK